MNSNFFGGTQNIPYLRYQKLLRFIKNNSRTIGEYKWCVANADFQGWLLCDGRSLTIAEYPELYMEIGGNFGSVDELHFNLPNFSGRVMAGIGSSGNDGDADHNLGDITGVENITLNTSQIPSHSHTGSTNLTTTGITSSGTTNTQTTGISLSTVANHNHTYQDAYYAEHDGVGSDNVFGNNGSNDTDNSFYWRTASGGYSTTPQDLSSGNAGSHTHSITDSGHTHSFTATINDPSHLHTFTTSTTGGGGSHPNTQPTVYGANMFIFGQYI